MDLESEFERRLAIIHGCDKPDHAGEHTAGEHTAGEHTVDIRHAEFQAMADVFLGETFDRTKLAEVEKLQIALHNHQAVLHRRFGNGQLGPEEYFNALDTLVRTTFAKYEDILGAETFLKLFRAPRSAVSDLLDREAFLHAHQPTERPRVVNRLHNGRSNLGRHRHARNELISLLQQPTDSWLEYHDVYWDLVERFCDDQGQSNPSLAAWWNSELRPVRLQLRSCSETMMRAIVIHTMTAIELYSQCIGEEESANQMKESKLRMLSG